MHPDIARLHIDDGYDAPVVTTTDNPQQSAFTSGPSRARDITREFIDASAELKQGQLIKDEFFTLFESVGALEIMDPKMDSGFMMPEKDAIVDNFDPLTPMLPEEILGLMDQMLCYEVAWHDGYPLSQTLFTSLHLTSITPQEYSPLEHVVFRGRRAWPVNPLISDVLRAWCLGLLKSCDSVIAEVISEHYYEEEDFVTQTFTQYLLCDIDEASILSVLDAAQQTLATFDLSDELKQAFFVRLELRKLLLRAVQPLPAVYHAAKTQLWQQVQSTLEAVNATTTLGQAVPAVFSERVQRHLASNAPPRPMISIGWSEAYPKLVKLCTDNIEAYRLCTIPSLSPTTIFLFVADFSNRKPQPGTYARAVLQGILFKSGRFAATIPHTDLLLTDIRELVLAGDPLLSPSNWEIELPSDPRHQVARRIDEFMAKSMEEFLNIPRMLAQNRCRMRRTLNQSIAILDSLQAEAELIDSAIHEIIAQTLASSTSPSNFNGATSPTQGQTFASSLEPMQFFPLAAWAYFHKLRVAEQTILLGFELDVYLPDEHASMYALLAFLAETLSDHLEHIDLFAQRRLERLSASSPSASVTAAITEVTHSRALLALHIAEARTTRFLAAALKTTYALLSTLGFITEPSRPYSSAELRYELRMRPFLAIGTPAVPSAAALASAIAIRPTRSVASVFASVDGSLRAARGELSVLKAATVTTEGKEGIAAGFLRGCEKSWGESVRGLLGTCVGLGVVVGKLRGVCKEVGVEDVKDVDGSRGEVLKGRLKVGVVPTEERWSLGWVVPKVVEGDIQTRK